MKTLTWFKAIQQFRRAPFNTMIPPVMFSSVSWRKLTLVSELSFLGFLNRYVFSCYSCLTEN